MGEVLKFPGEATRLGYRRVRKRGRQTEDPNQLDLFATPLTVEVGLPAGWRERVGTDGTARVAVLVVAKPIEMPRGAGERLEKLAAVEVRRDRPGEDRPLWGGIVRTEFVELRLPPRPPAAGDR